MWSATKKILGAALLATVVGLAGGYLTGLMLAPVGELFTSATGLSTAALTAFPADNVAIFFGLSGGVMGALNKGIELASNPAGMMSREMSGPEVTPALQGPALAKAPSLDLPPKVMTSPASGPSASVHAAQHGGMAATAALSQQIH